MSWALLGSGTTALLDNRAKSCNMEASAANAEEKSGPDEGVDTPDTELVTVMPLKALCTGGTRARADAKRVNKAQYGRIVPCSRCWLDEAVILLLKDGQYCELEPSGLMDMISVAWVHSLLRWISLHRTGPELEGGSLVYLHYQALVVVWN